MNDEYSQGVGTTVRPTFSWNFHDCKIAIWKDTQASNLLPKFIFITTLKKASNLEQKIFLMLLKTNIPLEHLT